MASSVLDIILRTRKQGTGVSESQREIQGLRQSLNQLGLGAVGSLAPLALVTGAIIGLERFTAGAARETIAYTENVGRISRALGIETEEASRVIQMLDDLQISQEAFVTSARIAVQNGIIPNIEGLADLSDRYLALHSAEARADLAQRAFGRNWVEFTRVLAAGGDVIRQNAAAIDSGLIVTAEGEAAVIAYRLSVDELNDRWLAFQMTIGQGVIPQLTNLLNLMAGHPELLRLTNQQLRQAARWYGDLPAQVDRYATAMRNVEQPTRNEAAAIRDLDAAMALLPSEVNIEIRARTNFFGLADDIFQRLSELRLGGGVTATMGLNPTGGGLSASRQATNEWRVAHGYAPWTAAQFEAAGWQHGGSFIVPGSGGPDSVPVFFMASPREEVTVRTPAQQRSGAKGGITIGQLNINSGMDEQALLASFRRLLT